MFGYLIKDDKILKIFYATKLIESKVIPVKELAQEGKNSFQQ